MEALNNQYWRAAERVRFTKRPQQRTSLEVLQRLLDHRGKDNENLVVVEISADKRHSQRMQMNRHMLLDECHKDVKPYGPAQKMLQKKQSLSRHDSRENLPAISRIHEAATVSQQVREGGRYRHKRVVCDVAYAMLAGMRAMPHKFFFRRVRHYARGQDEVRSHDCRGAPHNHR